MKKIAMICVTILFVTGSAHGALYTTEASWNTAVSGFTVLTEDFSAEPFADFNIQSDHIDGFGEGGISVSNGYGDFTGEWYDQVDDEVGKETTITFNTTIYGFGGYWDPNVPTGLGEGLELWINGSLQASIPNSAENEFYGVAGIGGFNTVVIRGGDILGGVETFTLDNAVYAVPVPGAILLGILGLSVAGAKLRRKARKEC